MPRKKPKWLIEKERSARRRIKPWQLAVWAAALVVALVLTVVIAYTL